MTTEITAQPLPRRSESGMHSHAINAAAGVLLAATEQGHRTPTGQAIALDFAGLLNSPEHAAEVEQMREQLAEQERAQTLHDHIIARDAEIGRLKAKLAEYERPADEDPIAYALTDAAKAIVDDAPARQLPALTVTCPYCAAKPDQLCTSHDGTRPRRRDVHRARTLAWQNAKEA